MGASLHPSHEPDAVLILPRDRTCASVARRFVRDRIAADAAPEALEQALLATSELVTNALLHGSGRIELRLIRQPGRVRVEVMDDGRGAAPAIREEPGDASGGFGLRIVEMLALRWGSITGTTHVWAELAL